MNKIPVLLLISSHIDLEVLDHSPRFQRYHFFSLAAINYLGNTSSNPAGQPLRNALNNNIDRLEAQYLLAHLGMAFDRYPVEFLSAVLDVYTLHPQLKIGLDKGLNYAIRYLRMSAALGPKVNSLAARLTRHQSAFDMDEETATLAACLY